MSTSISILFLSSSSLLFTLILHESIAYNSHLLEQFCMSGKNMVLTYSTSIPFLLELYGKNLETQTISTQQPKVVPTSSMNSPSNAAGQKTPLTRTCSSGIFTSTRTTEVASYTTNQADDIPSQSNMNYSEFLNIPATTIPNIPPPPIRLHPSQYPPPPLPWELPRVPSANATLPHGSQNMPNITEKPFHQNPSQFHSTGQLNTGALSALTSHPSTGTSVHGPLPASHQDSLYEPYHDHMVSKSHQPQVPNLRATNIQRSDVEYSQHGNNLQVSKNDSLLLETFLVYSVKSAIQSKQ